MPDWLWLLVTVQIVVTLLAVKYRPADERLRTLSFVAASATFGVLALREAGDQQVVGASVFALAATMLLVVAGRTLRRGPGV